MPRLLLGVIIMLVVADQLSQYLLYCYTFRNILCYIQVGSRLEANGGVSFR